MDVKTMTDELELEHKIELSVGLKIDKEVYEHVDELLEKMIMKDVEFVREAFESSSSKKLQLVGAKMESHLLDIIIAVKAKRKDILRAFEKNQQDIMDVESKLKDAYVRKNISPRVYTRDQLPYITQIPEERAKEVEAELAKEKLQWTKIV